MAKVVRFGLVGCGRIGATHADALQHLDEAELAAVCDANVGRAREFAEKQRVKGAFGSTEEMLDAVKLDAIVVATDHKHHFAPAMAAMKRGVNVIIEKPMTTSLEEAYTLLESAKAHGVKLGGVFQRRFFPASLRMHKAIEEGRLGRVSVAECVALYGRDRAYFAHDAWRGTWKGEGGGVLMNQASHIIDLLLWMVGVPNEVYGHWATLKHGDYIDVEDSSCAVVRFDSGALATITATTTLESRDTAPGYRVAVHGTAGYSVGLSGREMLQGLTDQWPFDPPETVAQWAAAEGGRPGFPAFHSDQLRDFALAVLEDREPTVTGLDAYRALEVIKAVYLSEARRQPIRLPMSAADRTEADRITGGDPT